MKHETLDKQAINAIVATLVKGDKVLIIPVKDGIRIFRIRRDEI